MVECLTNLKYCPVKVRANNRQMQNGLKAFAAPPKGNAATRGKITILGTI